MKGLIVTLFILICSECMRCQSNNSIFFDSSQYNQGELSCYFDRSIIVVNSDSSTKELYVEIISSKIICATFRASTMKLKRTQLGEFDLSEGLNKITLDVSKLPKGFYMLTVIIGEDKLNNRYNQTFSKF